MNKKEYGTTAGGNSKEFIEEILKENKLEVGPQLKKYLIKYGNLHTYNKNGREIRLYGITEKHKSNSDMIQQAKFIHDHIKGSEFFMPLRSLGRGLYIMADKKDNIYLYDVRKNTNTKYNIKVDDYIEQFKSGIFPDQALEGVKEIIQKVKSYIPKIKNDKITKPNLSNKEYCRKFYWAMRKLFEKRVNDSIETDMKMADILLTEGILAIVYGTSTGDAKKDSILLQVDLKMIFESYGIKDIKPKLTSTNNLVFLIADLSDYIPMTKKYNNSDEIIKDLETATGNKYVSFGNESIELDRDLGFDYKNIINILTKTGMESDYIDIVNEFGFISDLNERLAIESYMFDLIEELPSMSIESEYDFYSEKTIGNEEVNSFYIEPNDLYFLGATDMSRLKAISKNIKPMYESDENDHYMLQGAKHIGFDTQNLSSLWLNESQNQILRYNHLDNSVESINSEFFEINHKDFIELASYSKFNGLEAVDKKVQESVLDEVKNRISQSSLLSLLANKEILKVDKGEGVNLISVKFIPISEAEKKLTPDEINSNGGSVYDLMLTASKEFKETIMDQMDEIENIAKGGGDLNIEDEDLTSMESSNTITYTTIYEKVKAYHELSEEIVNSLKQEFSTKYPKLINEVYVDKEHISEFEFNEDKEDTIEFDPIGFDFGITDVNYKDFNQFFIELKSRLSELLNEKLKNNTEIDYSIHNFGVTFKFILKYKVVMESYQDINTFNYDDLIKDIEGYHKIADKIVNELIKEFPNYLNSEVIQKIDDDHLTDNLSYPKYKEGLIYFTIIKWNFEKSEIINSSSNFIKEFKKSLENKVKKYFPNFDYEIHRDYALLQYKNKCRVKHSFEGTESIKDNIKNIKKIIIRILNSILKLLGGEKVIYSRLNRKVKSIIKQIENCNKDKVNGTKVLMYTEMLNKMQNIKKSINTNINRLDLNKDNLEKILYTLQRNHEEIIKIYNDIQTMNMFSDSNYRLLNNKENLRKAINILQKLDFRYVDNTSKISRIISNIENEKIEVDDNIYLKLQELNGNIKSLQNTYVRFSNRSLDGILKQINQKQ